MDGRKNGQAVFPGKKLVRSDVLAELKIYCVPLEVLQSRTAAKRSYDRNIPARRRRERTLIFGRITTSYLLRPGRDISVRVAATGGHLTLSPIEKGINTRLQEEEHVETGSLKVLRGRRLELASIWTAR